MRALLLFVIGLAFGTAGGFLIAGGMGAPAHDHASHSDPSHDPADMIPWGDLPDPAPSLTVTPDAAGANVFIATNGFRFAPEAANGPAVPGEGHAHVYVNGEKVMRVYGPWLHLDGVSSGDVIRVTLNANSHAVYAGPKGPLAAEVTVP